MKTIFSVTYIIYTLVSILIISGDLFGSVTFGYGLGDWLYVVAAISIWIAISIIVLIKRRKSEGIIQLVITAVMIIVTVYLVLKVTLFRGLEYGWNGDLFIQ